MILVQWALKRLHPSVRRHHVKKSANNSIVSYLEVIGTGISLGELPGSSQFVITIVLSIIATLPTANRWAERWFTQDQ
jgi:hypothetical protein